MNDCMNHTEITFAREAAVGILTLNNAGKINALSKQMIGEILHLLEAVAADESLKVLIIKRLVNISVPAITWRDDRCGNQGIQVHLRSMHAHDDAAA
ncbi:hypothetical protein [Desulfosarcina cetonica]|uniref:hypothetical protein n=1 Tax=Desulfosarcina cetonica TaxID=90730 RepID=UPI001FEFAE78|nr:hypothetical protein [Desulfosarcina cetonica]